MSETDRTGGIPAAWHKQARANTQPLFFHEQFVATGHTAETKNATATFIKFKGIIWASTAGHVVDLLTTRKERGQARNPTLGMVVGRAILNFSSFGAAGPKLSFKTLRAKTGEDVPDIALTRMPSFFWELLTTKEGKTPIDLDAWREPKWHSINKVIGAGWPDEHKYASNIDLVERVASPLFLVPSDVAGAMGRHQTLVEGRSRLPEPHGYFFSGLSGGPIYAVQDDIMIPAGLIFEGWPQSKNSKPHDCLDDRDIAIRGLTLTPDNFGRWLTQAGLVSGKRASPD